MGVWPATRVSACFFLYCSKRLAPQVSNSRINFRSVFLTHTLAVLFRKTQTVTFTDSACSAENHEDDFPADMITSIKFSLDAEENRTPLSFLTYYSLTNEVQPRLVESLENKQAERLRITDTADIETIDREIEIIEDTISAWVRFELSGISRSCMHLARLIFPFNRRRSWKVMRKPTRKPKVDR